MAVYVKVKQQQSARGVSRCSLQSTRAGDEPAPQPMQQCEVIAQYVREGVDTMTTNRHHRQRKSSSSKR